MPTENQTNLFDALLNDLGNGMYVRSLLCLRWTRWPVLCAGIGTSGTGLWQVCHGIATGWITIVGGVIVVTLNLSTWALVHKFTDSPRK